MSSGIAIGIRLRSASSILQTCGVVRLALVSGQPAGTPVPARGVRWAGRVPARGQTQMTCAAMPHTPVQIVHSREGPEKNDCRPARQVPAYEDAQQRHSVTDDAVRRIQPPLPRIRAAALAAMSNNKGPRGFLFVSPVHTQLPAPDRSPVVSALQCRYTEHVCSMDTVSRLGVGPRTDRF